MKIAVYGLGAIGGLLAARLAASGHEVSAVARGATLKAVQERGLRLIDGTNDRRESVHRIHVTDSPESIGPQDVVIVSVKTTALPDIAPRVAPLMGPDTTVFSAMNGVPWWFFYGHRTGQNIRLNTVDPNGAITAAIPPESVVGSVTHLSAATPEPGTVLHVAGNLIMVGEPTGGTATPRAQAIVGALRDARFDIQEVDSIQTEIWYKLWGNMTMNPVSAITGATVDKALDDPYVRAFMSRCMLEAAEVGKRIGIPIDADPEDRHAVTRKLGAFRTSMLQDVEAGRPVELDALVAAVIEIGQQVGVEMPNIESLFGLARLYAQLRGLYPAPWNA